jgi:hypothetical protein
MLNKSTDSETGEYDKSHSGNKTMQSKVISHHGTNLTEENETQIVTHPQLHSQQNNTITKKSTQSNYNEETNGIKSSQSRSQSTHNEKKISTFPLIVSLPQAQSKLNNNITPLETGSKTHLSPPDSTHNDHIKDTAGPKHESNSRPLSSKSNNNTSTAAVEKKTTTNPKSSSRSIKA